jgi:hypothetical protein
MDPPSGENCGKCLVPAQKVTWTGAPPVAGITKMSMMQPPNGPTQFVGCGSFLLLAKAIMDPSGDHAGV